MVDRKNLQQVNMLDGELNTIDAVEQGFDNGGVIVSMEVSPGPLTEPEPGQPQLLPFGVRVSTVNITYPPQMVECIKAAFAQRRNQIEAELTGLGLTGIDQR